MWANPMETNSVFTTTRTPPKKKKKSQIALQEISLQNIVCQFNFFFNMHKHQSTSILSIYLERSNDAIDYENNNK